MVFMWSGAVCQTRVLLVIACHWAMAITLVFVNKQLVSSEHGDHDVTVFIAWAQCIFSVAAVFVATAIKRCLNPHLPWLSIQPVIFFHPDMLAMTFTFIGLIIMNNLLLKHIGVAFYQVARSSTLIFTVIFTRIFLRVRISFQVIVSCSFIMLGFVVSVDQEMLLSSLSWFSISYGVLASVSAALSGIFIKRAHKLVQGNSLEISLTNNVNSMIFLFPLMLSTGQFQFVARSDLFVDVVMWWRLALTGTLSLLVGWTSNKVIGLTSPVTHNMSINAKSLLQTFIAVLAQGETKTAMWWVGNFLVVLGLVNYSLSKAQHSTLQEIRVIPDMDLKGSPIHSRMHSKKNEILSI